MKKIFCIFVVLLIVSGQVFAQSPVDGSSNRGAVDCPPNGKISLFQKKRTPKSHNGKKGLSPKAKKGFSQFGQHVKEFGQHVKEEVTKIGPVLRERYGEPEEVIKEEKKEEPVKVPINSGIRGTSVRKWYRDWETDLDKDLIYQKIENESLPTFERPPQDELEEKAYEVKTGDLKKGGNMNNWIWRNGRYRVFSLEKGGFIVKIVDPTDKGKVLYEKTGEIPVSVSDVEIKYWVAIVYFDFGPGEKNLVTWEQILLIE